MDHTIENLLILQAWAHAIRDGAHEMSAEGWRVYCNKFDAMVEGVEAMWRAMPDDAGIEGTAIGNLETPCNVDPLEGDRPPNVVIFPGIQRVRSDARPALAVIDGGCVAMAKSGALGPRRLLQPVSPGRGAQGYQGDGDQDEGGAA